METIGACSINGNLRQPMTSPPEAIKRLSSGAGSLTQLTTQRSARQSRSASQIEAPDEAAVLEKGAAEIHVPAKRLMAVRRRRLTRATIELKIQSQGCCGFVSWRCLAESRPQFTQPPRQWDT
jgi:hypothetical protein